eukprot:scaffold61224_cov67-Phaeocystis_antarctica.AAC.1
MHHSSLILRSPTSPACHVWVVWLRRWCKAGLAGGGALHGAVAGAGGGVAARGGALHLGVAGLRGRLPQC